MRRPVELAESLVEHLGRVALEVGLARLHGEALGGGLPEDVDVHVLVGGHPLRGPGRGEREIGVNIGGCHVSQFGKGFFVIFVFGSFY